VRQKQSQGVGVQQKQAFGELRDFIDSKLLLGKFGKEAKFAPVTETQQKGVYENVRKAILDQEILKTKTLTYVLFNQQVLTSAFLILLTLKRISNIKVVFTTLN